MKAILVNLKRCTGCWTCSMACKIAHDLEGDEWWQVVRTIGNGAGLDEPGGTYPDNFMEWLPFYTQQCVFCPDRVHDGLLPHCVFNCPGKALTFGDPNDPQSDFSQRRATLEERGFTIYQLPAWEKSHPHIYYATKGK